MATTGTIKHHTGSHLWIACLTLGRVYRVKGVVVAAAGTHDLLVGTGGANDMLFSVREPSAPSITFHPNEVEAQTAADA